MTYSSSGPVLYRDGQPLAMCASPDLAQNLEAELNARTAEALPLVLAEVQRREDVVVELRRQITSIENSRNRLQMELAKARSEIDRLECEALTERRRAQGSGLFAR
jgi:hypothetical protein